MRTILIDESPFDIRAALIEGEEVVRLAHFHPGRAQPQRGTLWATKVTEIDGRMNAAFCDLGSVSGFLRRPGKLPAAGQRFLAEVKREGIGNKAAEVTDKPVLRLPLVSLAPGGDPRPGPLATDEKTFAQAATEATHMMENAGNPPPVIRLLMDLLANGAEAIDVTSVQLLQTIRPFVGDAVEVNMVDAVPARLWIDEAEEEALSRAVPLPGGGRMIVDEGEALTAIDLDIGKGGGQSKKGAEDRLLGEALVALGRHAGLASLGGQIIIDVPRGAIAAPKIIRDRITRSLKSLGRVSVPAVTPEGLCVVIAPRPGPSLLERLTVEAGGTVRHGRVFQRDVTAAKAWRAAEAALAADRAGRIALRLAPELADIFDDHAIMPLTERYGPRLEIVMDPGLSLGAEVSFHVQ